MDEIFYKDKFKTFVRRKTIDWTDEKNLREWLENVTLSESIDKKYIEVFFQRSISLDHHKILKCISFKDELGRYIE